MRTDFRSVLTHGRSRGRFPDAARAPEPLRDDDGVPIRPAARARILDKGWREGGCLRYGLVDRWLRAQVGRPWDAVGSDIARALEPALRRRAGLLRHVEEEVAIGPGGEVRDVAGRTVSGLYVDPRDGILRLAPHRSYKVAHRLRERCRLLLDPDLVPVTHPGRDPVRRVELRREGGVWYEYAYARRPAPPGAPHAIRVIRDGRPRHAFEDFVCKRQLPSREIRRLRLAEWGGGAASLRESCRAGRADDRRGPDGGHPRRGGPRARPERRLVPGAGRG